MPTWEAAGSEVRRDNGLLGEVPLCLKAERAAHSIMTNTNLSYGIKS